MEKQRVSDVKMSAEMQIKRYTSAQVENLLFSLPGNAVWYSAACARARDEKYGKMFCEK